MGVGGTVQEEPRNMGGRVTLGRTNEKISLGSREPNRAKFTPKCGLHCRDGHTCLQVTRAAPESITKT
jgi:hypothetical protein